MAISKIKISKDNEINLDSSMGWLLKYREQFGRDILPDLLPLISATVDFLIKTFSKDIDINKVKYDELLKNIDSDELDDLMIKFSMLEFTTIINIVWALNANFNSRNNIEIQNPTEWAEEMENFPLDEIIPQVVKLLLKSTMSSKKMTSLQKYLDSLKTTGKKLTLIK